LQAAGRDFGALHPEYVEALIEAGSPDDLTLFSYTSGTTSRPKGVMLSHANLLSPAEAFAAAEGLRASDEHLAYLPMAWVGNSLFSLALHMWVAFTCNFPEKPETLQRDLRELGPTIALAPPRFWENMLTAVTVRAADSSPLKRWLFSSFRGIAERAERCVAESRPVPLGLRLARSVGEVLVYGPLRDLLGLRTGDAGFFDRRGHLVIVDRSRDFGKLADGSVLAPQLLENKLKFSPYIGEAVVFGHDRPFFSAIVAIDAATVGNWAERHNLAYTSFQDLCARAEVLDLVRDEIGRCNAGLPEAIRVRRFLVLNKEFDADDDEITRTRKIRRSFVAEKYAAVVEALYNEAPEVEVSAESTYEDGRKAMLRSRLVIGDVDQPS